MNKLNASLKNIDKQTLRLFAGFFIGFFLLASVLTAFVVIPEINARLEEQHIKDDQDKLAIEAELLKRFIEDQRSTLSDLALFPLVVNATMLSSSDNADFTDLFGNTSINGKKARLVLQDIAGNVVFKTENEHRGDYREESPWVSAIIDAGAPYHLKLLDPGNGDVMILLSVPVTYAGHVEGVLSVEITKPLSTLFSPNAFHEAAAFRLAQGDVSIETDSSDIALPREFSIRLPEADLTLTYIEDNTPIIAAEHQLRNTILVTLLIGLVISFLLFALLSYRTLTNKEARALNKQSRWKTYSAPLIIATLGLTATFTTYVLANNLHEEALDQRMISDSNQQIQAIRQEVLSNIKTLDALKAFYDASSYVDRQEFKTFVKPLLESHPTIQALEWIPKVPRHKRAIFEKLAQEDGLTDFVFTDKNDKGELITAGPQSTYYPIYYAEPHELNSMVLGLSPTYAKSRDLAIEAATNSGKMMAAEPFKLTQEIGAQLGYIILKPVYDGAPSYNSEEERKRKLKGFLMVVLRASDLITSTIKQTHMGISVEDITDTENPQAIYSSGDVASANMISATSQSIKLNNRIEFADRTWQVATSIDPSTYDGQTPWASWLIPLCGILFTIIISTMIAQLIRRRAVVEETVKQRTAELVTTQQAITQAVEGISHIDPDGHYIELNAAYAGMAGYTPAELRGKPWSTTVHPDDMPHLELAYADMLRDGKVVAEARGIRKDGSEFYKCVTMVSQYDELQHFVGHHCFMQDITERKQAAEAIQEGKAFLDLINSNNPDLIFVKDADFKIVEANPAFISAYPARMHDKIIGYTTVEEYPSEEAEAFLKKDQEAFEKGYSETIESITFPDGKVRILSTKKIRFKNKKDQPFILGIARDVTEREKLVAKLVDSNTELERFAYVASHDMQEPLRMVVNFGDILSESCEGKLNEDEAHSLDIVINSGRRMQEMVSDLLEYSRMGSGERQVQSVDGAAELRKVLENLGAYIDETDTKITHDDLPRFDGQPIQFMRLLQNLITNGIKYQAAGNAPNIHIGVKDMGPHWCIFVKDNGLGIEESFVDQVFQPFRRLHSWDSIQGTGLGLAICSKIVQNHGGKIWVESKPTEGSTFFFTIAKPTSKNQGIAQ